MDMKARLNCILWARGVLQTKEKEAKSKCMGLKGYRPNSKLKKTESIVILNHKTGFKTKGITRDKGGHFIMAEGLIHQKGKTLLCICMYAKYFHVCNI